MKNYLRRVGLATAILIVVTALSLCGCSQPDDSPIPIGTSTTTTPVVTNSHNFEGQWNCYDWVVDDITGMTHHRRISFYNQVGSTANISVNEYISSGTLIQLVTMSNASIDSNYFDNSINPLPVKFKGVLTSDSTLMVYEYYIGGLNIDTSQVKEFKKD